MRLFALLLLSFVSTSAFAASKVILMDGASTLSPYAIVLTEVGPDRIRFEWTKDGNIQGTLGDPAGYSRETLLKLNESHEVHFDNGARRALVTVGGTVVGFYGSLFATYGAIKGIEGLFHPQKLVRFYGKNPNARKAIFYAGLSFSVIGATVATAKARELDNWLFLTVGEEKLLQMITNPEFLSGRIPTLVFSTPRPLTTILGVSNHLKTKVSSN